MVWTAADVARASGLQLVQFVIDKIRWKGGA